jgi:hypothetical protein
MVAASTVRRAASRPRATRKVATADKDKDRAQGRRRSPAGASKGKGRAKGERVTGQVTARVTRRETMTTAESVETPPLRKRTTEKKPAKPTKAKPGTLVQRVYNTIDGELQKLEKQKGLTSQDRERASRALSQMVNALEKAVEMQRNIAKTKSPGGDARTKEALAHAEDLRREIAERLERLNRKRPVGRRSE